MTWDPNRPPTPEQLTAYYDGELEPAARAHVAAWLDDHPDGAADLAAWQRVDAVWKETRPDDPGEDAWAATRARLDAALATPPRRTGGWWLGAGAAAAALLAVSAWAFWPGPKPPPRPQPPVAQLPPKPGGGSEEADDNEPFPVVAPDRVRVLCMEGSDTHVEIDGVRVCALVGAELPVPDEELRPTSFDRTAPIRWDGLVNNISDWDVPMLVDPAVLASGWHP